MIKRLFFILICLTFTYYLCYSANEWVKLNTKQEVNNGLQG